MKTINMLIIGIIFLTPYLMAFAVSSQYYDNNPLYMKPGESVETFFTLQNVAGETNITVKAEITDGKNIVELSDVSDIYIVPKGEKTRVNFKVMAPSDSKIGDKFPLTIMFKTVTSQGENPIALSSSIGKGFEVIIGEPSRVEEVPIKKNNYLWIDLIVVLIVVIIFVLINRKYAKKGLAELRNFK